jgi:hypothetical protein
VPHQVSSDGTHGRRFNVRQRFNNSTVVAVMRGQLNAYSIASTAMYVFAACALLILLLVGLMLYMSFRSKREARRGFARHVARIKARTTTSGATRGADVHLKGEPTWIGGALSAINTGSENPTREIRIPEQVRRVTYVLRPGEHPAVLPICPHERIDPPTQPAENHEPPHLLPQPISNASHAGEELRHE